jgi:DNA primase
MPRFTPDQNRKAIQQIGLSGGPRDYSTRRSAFFSCCFHTKDNTPSLRINFEKGGFHCFGCGESGSISNLIWRKTGIGMSRFLGLEKDDLDKLSKKEEEVITRKIAPVARDLDIRGVLIPFNMSEMAKTYLQSRYISLLTAAKMNMKYTTAAYISGAHVQEDKTFFKDRLMIPIYNDNGQMINIEGRDVTSQQKKKVLYPVGGRKVLYEWYKLDKNSPLFVVEGLIKLGALRSDSYFENSSSTMGNMISPLQVNQLNLFKEVVIIPDNDQGGIAMIRFFKEVLNTSTKISVYRIGNPDVKDVDDIPKKTGKTVEQFRLGGGFHLEKTL